SHNGAAVMTKTLKHSSTNRLKDFIERSPILTLCTVVLAVAATIYGALNWLYASRYEVEIQRIKFDSQSAEDTLKRQYSDKIRELEDERSRIRFAINDQSSFLDLKTLVADEEQLGTNYKAPRTIAGFGDSALAERTSAGLVPR